MKKSLELIGQYFILMKVVFSTPDKKRIFWKQFFIDAEKLVLNSIPIVAVISVFIGAVLVIQTAYNIESPLIPKMYVGYMTRESLILEFCSTMIALILAGKVGSNISSEIGSMRISEQIDAMEMMGINSANYLILPKIAAATILNPLLMLMSFVHRHHNHGPVYRRSSVCIPVLLFRLQYGKNGNIQFPNNEHIIFLRILRCRWFTWSGTIKHKGYCCQ